MCGNGMHCQRAFKPQQDRYPTTVSSSLLMDNLMTLELSSLLAGKTSW